MLFAREFKVLNVSAPFVANLEARQFACDKPAAYRVRCHLEF